MSNVMNRNVLGKNKFEGGTAAGWMIIIAVILFFAYLAMKLIPPFFEFSNVKKVMESTSLLDTKQMALPKIEEKFTTKIGFARLENVITKDTYKVKQTKDGKILSVNYNKEVKMFGNVYGLIKFSHEQPLK